MMLQHAPQHRGLATSTDSTYKYAKIYFGIWGLTNDIDSFDDLIAQNREDILCAKDTWFQFGTWLHSTGRQIQNQKKNIDSGAALNYLSALTTLSTEKWPSNSIWTNRFDPWYTNLRREVEKEIGRREIEAGDDDGKELQDVDRLTMIRLCQRWNRIGTQDALIKACAAVLTFLCMGRSAEYKFLSGKLRTCTPYLFITNVLTSLLIVSFFQCQLPSCASMWHSKRS